MRRGDLTTTSIIDDSGSPIAAPPTSPARSAIGVRSRARAAGVILASCASLGLLASYAWRHRVEASGLDASPFKIENAAWRSVLTVAATREPSCPPSIPVVILYVSGSCIHCQAELGRWANLVRSGAPQLSCVGVAVVAAPSRAISLPHWLPTELASTLLWDHDGAVARGLDVRLVPLAAYVTRKGIVIAKVVGEASEESTGRHLADLRRTSDASRGVH